VGGGQHPACAGHERDDDGRHALFEGSHLASSVVALAPARGDVGQGRARRHDPEHGQDQTECAAEPAGRVEADVPPHEGDEEHIGPGRHLSDRDGIGELGVGQPPALVDQVAVHVRRGADGAGDRQQGQPHEVGGQGDPVQRGPQLLERVAHGAFSGGAALGASRRQVR
jgi:hypothetical protein